MMSDTTVPESVVMVMLMLLKYRLESGLVVTRLRADLYVSWIRVYMSVRESREEK